jgi:hypothetical protein
MPLYVHCEFRVSPASIETPIQCRPSLGIAAKMYSVCPRMVCSHSVTIGADWTLAAQYRRSMRSRLKKHLLRSKVGISRMPAVQALGMATKDPCSHIVSTHRRPHVGSQPPPLHRVQAIAEKRHLLTASLKQSEIMPARLPQSVLFQHVPNDVHEIGH